MLKRVISLVVGASCLLSMTSAFAAITYDATRTEYYAANQIKVTSTVSGATGDTATYLVYDKDLADASEITQGSDIVYVDQYKFTEGDGGTWSFSYVTDNANIGANVKVGNGATAGVSAPATIPGISYPVTVTSGSDTWKATGWTDAAENSWVKVPYDNKESIITAVTFNGSPLDAEYWFTAVDALWIGGQTWSKDANTIVVTTEATVASSATTLSMAYFDGKEATEEGGYDAADANTGNDPSVVVVGQVVGDSSNFGIILAKTTEELTASLAAINSEAWDGASPYKKSDAAVILPSLAKNSEGKFAIRVYDNTAFAAESSIYAAVYYKTATGYEISDNCKTLTIPNN